MNTGSSPAAPPVPQPLVSVGVTGHRSIHPSFPPDTGNLEAAIAGLLAQIERAAKDTAVYNLKDPKPRFRMVSLLADGVDQIAAEIALDRDWALQAPLPFGVDLNTALASSPINAQDARAILDGGAPTDPETTKRAERTRAITRAAQVFEIRERDAMIEKVFLSTLEAPEVAAHASDLQHETAQRARIAGQILIEQCDVLIAVWDGTSTINVGGTGHTALRALEAGVPVFWIDPTDPSLIRLVRLPEALEIGTRSLSESECEDAVRSVITSIIGLGPPPEGGSQAGLTALSQTAWRDTSSRFSHAYRRVETLFGEKSWSRRFRSLRQRYERPDAIADGEHAPMLQAIDQLDKTSEASFTNR